MHVSTEVNWPTISYIFSKPCDFGFDKSFTLTYPVRYNWSNKFGNDKTTDCITLTNFL